MVGAGRMGLPIIGHLARKGFAVLVHDVDAGKQAAAEARGGRWLADPAALARESDAVLICVGYDRELRQLLSADGLPRDARRGTILAILSTVHPGTVRELAESNGGTGFQWATDEGTRAKLWKARHEAYFAGLSLRPGCDALVTDVCVPISRLAECIVETKKDVAGTPLLGAILGHVGDGNYHVAYLTDPSNPNERELAEELNERMVNRAIAMGGTCTGEHGIGLGKMKSLLKEHGDSVPVMAAIKRALDPLNLMNPGKIFPYQS